MYKRILISLVYLGIFFGSQKVSADYLDLSVTQNQINNTTLNVSFNVEEHWIYKYKVRKVGTSEWDGPHEISASKIQQNSTNGIFYATLLGLVDQNQPLECGTEYQVKVKRKGRFYRSANATTKGCGLVACPYGGYFDQKNCQIGQAPAGTNAFIHEGYYYYTPLNNNNCPYPGSWFDGANCQVQQIPSGVIPFIHLNHWYYVAYP